MAKSAKNRKSSPVGFILISATLLLGGATIYAKYGPGNQIPVNEQRGHQAAQKEPVDATAEGEQATTETVRTKVSVPKPKYQGEHVDFDHHDVAVKAGENPYIASVNAYLKGAKITPPDAVVQSASVENGVLVLSFSPTFEKTYGSDDEQTLLKGIEETVKQFKEVRGIRFLIGTHRLETLGNVDLTQDLSVSR